MPEHFNYAYFVIQICGDGESKALTYDLPKGMPIPDVGEMVEIVFGGMTVPVKSRTWSIRDRVEIKLQGIWALPDDDADTEGWSVCNWMDVNDVSNELHSAGWES